MSIVVLTALLFSNHRVDITSEFITSDSTTVAMHRRLLSSLSAQRFFLDSVVANTLTVIDTRQSKQ